MIDVKTNAAVTLRSGIVKLTDEQARRRMSCLQTEKQKGVYQITGAIQMKAGEEFGLEEIPKSMENDIDKQAKPRKQADKDG